MKLFKVTLSARIFIVLALSVIALWMVYGQEGSPMDLSFGHGKQWQQTAARQRREIMAKIPKEWILPEGVLAGGKARKKISGEFIESLLDLETLEITSTDNDKLLNLMANGSYSALQVVSAFCKRAAYAHQLVRPLLPLTISLCKLIALQNQNLLQVGFDTALQKAKELDRYYQLNQKTTGPLHGLPVSLKDQFHVKGLETTMAYVGWIGTFEGHRGTGKERIFESEIVRELQSLGAVIIAKVGNCIKRSFIQLTTSYRRL